MKGDTDDDGILTWEEFILEVIREKHINHL